VEIAPPQPPTRRLTGSVLAVWAAVAALNAGSQLLGFAFERPAWAPASPWIVVWSHVSFSAAWAACTPLVFSLGRRLPLRRLREPRVAIGHAGALALLPALAVAVTFVVFNLGLGSLWGPPGELVSQLPAVFASHYGLQLLTYLEALGVVCALQQHHEAGDAEARAARLSGQLAAARLASLRTQLHPHFLFNTLNSLMPLIGTRPEEAERMLRKLGELFRGSLARTSPLTTLRDEIDFVTGYLDLQRARYGARLQVEVSADAGLDGAAVPPLILQPLVENAIRHGLSPRPGPGHLEIRAGRSRDRLVLEVLDDGLGLHATGQPGVGLANSGKRLRQLFGDEQRLELSSRPGGGTTARIEIPFTLLGGRSA